MKSQNEQTPTAVMAALQADHATMESSFQRVLGSFHGGERDVVRAEWLALEAQLGSHMKAEEQLILPLFERAFPHEAAQIRAEHHAIRQRLELLGVDLDLHTLRASAAAEFIAGLREHAQREESALYAWAERELPETRRNSVLSRLRKATSAAAADGSAEEVH